MKLDPKLHKSYRSVPFRQLDFGLALDGALAGPGANTELPLEGLDLVRLRNLVTKWVELAIEEVHDRGLISEARVVDRGIRLSLEGSRLVGSCE